jgi:TIR domain-containing protein
MHARGIPPPRTERGTMATDTGAPRVFISHASEDKAFVLDFASRLRQRGVDAWLDRWEILPGDSFVSKIFEEGIAQAKAIIVVISKSSVAKPWVREELDVAVVRKINKVSKLIPVVIDESPVPTCLQATLWVKIGDPRSFEEGLDRIVLSIFGQTDKPAIGERPPYALKPVLVIGDLTRADSLVLQAACELCLEDGNDLQFFGSDVVARVGKLGISEEAAGESLAILAKRGHLKHELEDNFFVTSTGFEEYLKVHRPDYERLLKQFASDVVNKGMWDSDAIGASLEVPYVLLNHVFEVFQDRKWIIAERYGTGRWEIAEGGYSPEMKRWLES